MKELIVLRRYDIIALRNYGGVCHYCNSPIYFDGEIRGVKLGETEESFIFFFVDRMSCPYCGEMMTTATIYKNVNITKELEAIKHE